MPRKERILASFIRLFRQSVVVLLSNMFLILTKISKIRENLYPISEFLAKSANIVIGFELATDKEKYRDKKRSFNFART